MSTRDGDKVHARYSMVERRLWNDDTGLSPIQPSGQGLWLYLLTTPFLGILPGILVAGRAAIAEHLGWELADFDKAFAELEARGMAVADWKNRVVLLPKALRNAFETRPPESPNVIRGWKTQLLEVPNCKAKSEYYRTLRSLCDGLGQAFAKALAEAFGEGFAKGFPEGNDKPSPNQIQIQEQIQEQTQKRDVVSSRAPVPSPADDSHAPEPTGSGSLTDSTVAPSVGPSVTAEAVASVPDRAPPATQPPSPAVPQQALLSLVPSPTPSPKPKGAATQVYERYLAGWRKHVGGTKPPVLTEAREKLITRRLKEGFTLECLLRAADGVWESSFHVGDGYHQFELVFRDAEHVEKFRDRTFSKAGSGGSAGGGQKPTRDPSHDAVFAAWRKTYQASTRRYGEYVPAAGDDEAIAQLIVAARAAVAAYPVEAAQGSALDPEVRARALLAHWFKSFLRDDGGKDRWLMDRRHGIKHLPSRLTEYGYPKGWSDAVASGAPAASGAAQRGEPPVVLTEADKAARSDAMARLTRGIGGGHVSRSGDAQAAE